MWDLRTLFYYIIRMPYKNPEDRLRRARERYANLTEEEKLKVKEKRKEQGKKYYEANKEKLIESMKEYNKARRLKEREKMGEKEWERRQEMGRQLKLFYENLKHQEKIQN